MGNAGSPGERGDVHDVPAPSLEHPGQQEMGELDRRAQVHPQHPFQVVAGEVVELALQLATGVVHQHPDRPKDLLSRRHECPLALRIVTSA